MNATTEEEKLPNFIRRFCDFLGKNALFIIGIVYVLAILSVNTIALESLVLLAPVLYIIDTAFMFVSHERPRKNLLYCFLTIIILGYIIELIAFQTQAVFGVFSFGNTLGLKLFGTPLLIGIHWFLLGLGSAYFIRWIFTSHVMWVLGGALLTIIGFVITDPVAQSLDIWSWENYSFTFQNYSIRFIVSIAMQMVILLFLKKEKNQFAGYFFILTTLFFIISNLVL